MRYKHNRLQQLRGFYYAARAKSMSKAAEKMELSQPSVSLQIQALERELGAQLFEPQIGRGQTLTETFFNSGGQAILHVVPACYAMGLGDHGLDSMVSVWAGA